MSGLQDLLHMICTHVFYYTGNMDTLSDVIKRSAATANMINKDGATPLMYATRAGNKKV